MAGPDYEGAKAYAINLLTTQLAPELCYHNVGHTTKGVMPAAARLAQLSGVGPEEAELLQVAAAFHDVGFIRTNRGHEIVGVRIAAQVLPGFGFSDHQIEQILGMILATRLPQTPFNLLEEILADADLDILGRDQFFERNEMLRCELEYNGQSLSPCQWYEIQLDFLSQHSYFTAAARRLRGPCKRSNFQKLQAMLLEECHEHPALGAKGTEAGTS
jgi:uncharacterized protein